MESQAHIGRGASLSCGMWIVIGGLSCATHAHAQTTLPRIDAQTETAASSPPASAAFTVKPTAAMSETEWSSLRATYECRRHALFVGVDAYQARNQGQQWLARFDGRGVTLRPDAGGWTWGLELARFGFAGEDREVCSPLAVCADGQRMTYAWDATWEEWWVNSERGLEHGYTVHERPTPWTAGPLTITLAVRGDLSPRVQADGRGLYFSTAFGVDALTYTGLSVFDADGLTLPARFQASGSTVILLIDERGARYPLTIDPIAQQAYLKASNTSAGDQFGGSISVWGDTVVVGARFEDSGATGVNGNQSDNGALDSGAAYVFVRSGAVWIQEAYLKASNTDAGDQFGWSVSVSGDTLVVATPAEDGAATGVNGNELDNSANGAGAAYVFVRNGGTWSQQAYLKASNAEATDNFGSSTSVSGDTLVVGAFGEDSSATGVNGSEADNSAGGAGAAYVFVRNGTAWTQQAYIKASNTGANDFFASSVSVSGDTVVVGSPLEDGNATGVNGTQNDGSSDAGAAYVFVRSATTWSQEAYVKASNTGGLDRFGSSVSVSTNTIVIGALDEASNATGVNGNQSDDTADSAGAAYVFVRNGSTWSQQAYLKASNTETNDYFGSAVAVAGDTAVIGAVGEDSNATGLNGNQNNNSLSSAGAAYVFARSGTTWTQRAYLKASNTGAVDVYGGSVSVDGDTIAVGAIREASNATGVNGLQSDNSALNAGAVYVLVAYADPTPYCFGDGSGTACPCSHVGAPSRGCPNFAAALGAELAGSGVASIAFDTLALTSTNAIPFGPGLYFQGSAPIAAGTVFGHGLLCVTGSTPRLEIRFADSLGTSSTTVPIHILGSTAASDVRYYQMWYRDDPGYCPNVGFNLTNALSITWTY